MPIQLITKRVLGGEYSTIITPDGIIETLFFGDDGTSRLVNRIGIKHLALEDIEADMNNKEK